jgi:hypothetical protein
MNPIDLLIVASQFLGPRNKRTKTSRKIQQETTRIEREDRQIARLIEEQEKARIRRINGL